MVHGKVQWFDDAKGFGMIRAEDGSDVFVHYSAILGQGYRTLAENEEVTFEIEEDPKGPRAAALVATGLIADD